MEEQKPQKPLNWIIVTIVIAGGIVLAGAGFGYHFHTKQVNELKREITELNTKRTEIENEKNKAKDKEIEMSAWLVVTKDALFSTIDSMDKMDKILLEDDKKSRVVIDWMRENGKFTIADGTLATANVKLEAWDEYIAQSDKDYKDLKSKIDNDLDTLSKQLDSLNTKRDTSTQTQ